MRSFPASILGYTFAVAIAHIPIWAISRRMWKDLEAGSSEPIRSRSWHASLIGIIERALYVGSIQMKVPAFVGVWLALKVAGGWTRWSKGYPDDASKPRISGREFLNTFLVGTGLSLGYAATGAMMIRWLQECSSLAYQVPLVLLVFTGIIYLFVWWKTK